jgi:outer membrane murein-binding lipoprotein Lpp
MKKKILLTLATAVLFVCIFALCVNAAQREKFQSYLYDVASV